MQTGASKRQKEIARAQHRKDKETEKTRRREAKAKRPQRGAGDEDPDIAGIVPGPQPLLGDRG